MKSQKIAMPSKSKLLDLLPMVGFFVDVGNVDSVVIIVVVSVKINNVLCII